MEICPRGSYRIYDLRATARVFVEVVRWWLPAILASSSIEIDTELHYQRSLLERALRGFLSSLIDSCAKSQPENTIIREPLRDAASFQRAMPKLCLSQLTLLVHFHLRPKRPPHRV